MEKSYAINIEQGLRGDIENKRCLHICRRFEDFGHNCIANICINCRFLMFLIFRAKQEWTSPTYSEFP